MARVRRPLVVLACCLALVTSLAACGSGLAPAPVATDTATLTLAARASGSSSAQPLRVVEPSGPSSAPPVRVAVAPGTALRIADVLVQAGLPVTQVVAQSEGTDPDGLLGRPGQYTQRVAFDIPGGDASAAVGEMDRGGVIELWPSPADAQGRADGIRSVLKNGGMLASEHDYVHGSVLVRITGKVLPSIAESFQAALP